MYIAATAVSPELAERLEFFFCDEGLVSWGFESAPGTAPTLKGYFETGQERADGIAAIRHAFPEIEGFENSEIADREWQDAYKAFLQPWSTGCLHWVPTWQRETYPAPDGHVALYLDAGMAFGTGSHETTRLMARRILVFRQDRGNAFAEAEIIDAGCGSGILALSAVLLGARQVYGFDMDPEAKRVSEENTRTNGLDAGCVTFAEAGIEEGLAGRRADMLVANIQADVLKIHAEGFLAAIKPGGTLALSGILTRELEDVHAHFNAIANRLGLSCQVDSRVDGEWTDLCYTLM